MAPAGPETSSIISSRFAVGRDVERRGFGAVKKPPSTTLTGPDGMPSRIGTSTIRPSWRTKNSALPVRGDHIGYMPPPADTCTRPAPTSAPEPFVQASAADMAGSRAVLETTMGERAIESSHSDPTRSVTPITTRLPDMRSSVWRKTSSMRPFLTDR